MRTDIEKIESEIAIYQQGKDETDDHTVFLSEQHVAQIVALKFWIENFTYDDLIDAMKLWHKSKGEKV